MLLMYTNVKSPDTQSNVRLIYERIKIRTKEIIYSNTHQKLGLSLTL